MEPEMFKHLSVSVCVCVKHLSVLQDQIQCVARQDLSVLHLSVLHLSVLQDQIDTRVCCKTRSECVARQDRVCCKTRSECVASECVARQHISVLQDKIDTRKQSNTRR